jgi:hypothetical protein
MTGREIIITTEGISEIKYCEKCEHFKDFALHLQKTIVDYGADNDKFNNCEPFSVEFRCDCI